MAGENQAQNCCISPDKLNSLNQGGLVPPAGNEWEGRNQNTCTDAVSIMYGNIKGWVLLSAIRKSLALCTCLHVFPVPFLPPLPSYLTKVHNPPLLKMFSLFFPGFCAAALRVLPNPTKGEHYLP